MSESIGSVAAQLRREKLATALANAKEAAKFLLQAQYAIAIGQIDAHGQVMEARGALAKLLDALEREGREAWADGSIRRPQTSEQKGDA